MLSTYESCPAKWSYRYVDHLPQAQNKFAKRGSEIHREAEDYLKGKLRQVPASLEKFKEEFKKLKQNEVPPEKPWYFDQAWKHAVKDQAWGVAKVDAHWVEEREGKRLLVVEDHKTGRVRDHSDQGKLYVTAGMSIHLNIDEGTYRFWYLDQGVSLPVKPIIYPIRRLRALQQEYEYRVEKMFGDKRRKPTPSAEACRWCDYAKSKGGPCRYG